MEVTVAGSRIAYDVKGDGPVLLLLHAFPLSKAMWDAERDAFAAQCRVVRFDARGFGESDLGRGPLTMDEIAEEAVAVLDAAGAKDAVVCGLSMGGYAAFALWRRAPERVRALVLCDTRSGADADEAKKNRAALAEKVRAQGAGAAVEALLPKLLGATTHRDRADVVLAVQTAIGRQAPEAIANALAGLAERADSTPTLATIRVPTLVVCGEEDVLTPVAEAEALQRGVAGSRALVIPKAGHLSNLEASEAFHAALRPFLDAVR